jgi:hypothetical protein
MTKRYDALLKRLPKNTPIIGAELGVWKGAMSRELLRQSPKMFLYMVDRWQVPPEGDSYFQGSRVMARSTQAQFDTVFQTAVNAVSPYADRCKILKMTTIEAADYIDNNSLDFIFVDSDHSYIGVTNDLTYWTPKLKKGAILSGHDFNNSNTYNEVERAVKDFLGDRFKDIELDVDHTWFLKW